MGNLLHALSLAMVLGGAWLLFSGYFVTLLLALGVASCLLVVGLAWRMDIIDREGHPIHMSWRAVTYFPWLAWQIIKSNFDVAKLVLSPTMAVSPRVIQVRASQPTELGRVIYANSITLTPGTVSMRVRGDVITVHALGKAFADDVEAGGMDRRVSAVDTGG